MISAAGAAPPLSQTRSFHLDAAPARVLPLFTAQGERRWEPGWEPEMLSGAEQRGSAWRTRADGRQTLWIVTDYAPAAGRASYARVVQDSSIGLVDVVCRSDGAGGTTVSVTYTLTGLGAKGRAQVRDFMQAERYSAFVEQWRQALSALLRQDAPPHP